QDHETWRHVVSVRLRDQRREFSHLAGDGRRSRNEYGCKHTHQSFPVRVWAQPEGDFPELVLCSELAAAQWTVSELLRPTRRLRATHLSRATAVSVLVLIMRFSVQPLCSLCLCG